MNKKDKNKIESNVRHDILLKADQIYDTFKQYSTGVRVLFLLHRKQEGGETNNTKVRKIITRDPEEFRLELIKLVDEKERSDIPYRIYASLNTRSMKRAIRSFKYLQLDTESQHEDELQNFYYDIKNRFLLCLMKPQNAESNLFLFDCDSSEGWSYCLQELSLLNVKIIDQYKTKNGWHVITEPFNPTTFKETNECSIMKDALILLAY